MNDGNVSAVYNLERFEEKAKEISVSAVYNLELIMEKLQLVEAEKKKMRQEYKKKEKQNDISKKEV